jgi:SAM-dependent methyltransferase
MPSAPLSSAPLVFDRKQARLRLERALRSGFAGFLVERATDDLIERLGAVLRKFDHLLDLGTPISVASDRLKASGLAANIVWAGQAGDIRLDEEVLPFASESFDLAVSLLALQGVNDLPGTLVQLRRALKPDGLFIGCLLGRQSLQELRQAFLEAETEIEGGASPRVAPFADVRDMGSLLQRAGFALPVTDSEIVTVRYGDMFGLMRDLRAMGWTNTLMDRRKTPLKRAVLLRAADIYATRFADADGRVRATFELVWLSGWAPHESQQKPLAPGSARTRLADALGVTEIGTGEKPGN